MLIKRLLCFADGVYEPPKPPTLLSSLTDEVLVMASDVVAATVVEWQNPASEPMSQRGRLQLLAQVVADARGYALDEPLDKALALTIGKRLERQAAKVRDDMVAATAAAAAERQRLREAAEGSESLSAALPAELAKVDEVEQAALQAPRDEIYIGFHELPALLAAEPEPEPAMRYPWIPDPPPFVPPPADRLPPAIPPDLVAALGPEATQVLWENEMADRAEYPLVRESDDWWSTGLPFLVKTLLTKLKHAHAEQTRDATLRTQVASYGQSVAAMRAEMDAAMAACDREAEAAEAENERLRGELREAKGREKALMAALAMLRPSGEAMAGAGAQ